MSAVLRVWWTFLTALPVQGVLIVVGATLFGLAVVVALLMGESIWLAFGYLAFLVFAAFPALFTAPSLFRALSAPRMYQLLPHFRLRMLIAVGLLLCTLLVLAAGGIVMPTLAAERAFPLFALGVAAAFIVVMFLFFFLTFGDWRWGLLAPISFVPLVKLREWSPATVDFVAALPAWVLPVAALGAWAIFSAWYLHVRQVRPVMLMPQQRAVAVDAARPVRRAVAIRTLLASNPQLATSSEIGLRTTPLQLFAVAVVLALLTTGLRFFSLTTVFWPLAFMLFFGERSVAIVRQSRLLWLNVPGSRDAVRSEVEKALWRNWAIGTACLVFIAMIAASPLVGAGAVRALLGLAVTAGAAIYGTYVAMAAVPSVATYFWGFGPMVLLHIVVSHGRNRR